MAHCVKSNCITNVFHSLGPGSAGEEKGKKRGLSGGLGRRKVQQRPRHPFPSPDYPLARFAHRIFFFFCHASVFFSFFPQLNTTRTRNMHELFDNYVIPEDRNAYWNSSLSIFNILWCYCKGHMAEENACNAGYLKNWYLPTTRHPPPRPWPILCLLPWRWVRRHYRLHSHIVLALVAEGPKESKHTTGKNDVILEVSDVSRQYVPQKYTFAYALEALCLEKLIAFKRSQDY